MSMKKPLHTLRSPAIYLCILTTVFLVVMAAENAGFTRKNAFLSQVFHFSTQDQLIDCSSDWTFKDGTPAQLDQLAVQTHGRNEPMAVIYTTIPIVSQQSNYLLFSSINTYFTVSVEGRIICNYSYTPYKTAGKSYGSFTNIAFGSAGRYYYQLIHQSLPAFLNSLAIIIYGALLLMLSPTMKLNTTGSLNTSIRGFSLFSILYGIWALEECSGGILFWNSTQIWRSITYLPSILLPYTMVTTISGWHHLPRRLQKISGWTSLGEFVYLLLAWALFHLDFHDNTGIIMSILAVTSILVVIIAIRKEIIHLKQKTPDKTVTIVTIAILLLFIAIASDLISYNSGLTRNWDSLVCSRIIFLIFLLIMTSQYVNNTKERLETSAKEEAYRRMAYTDTLTGLGNRTSFEILINALQHGLENGEIETCLLGAVDLDRLKAINDTEGHIAGDYYIFEGERVLSTALEPTGKVFRTGGDEFVFVLIGKERVKLMMAIAKKIEQLSKQRNVSLSWGTAVYTAGSKQTVEDVFQDADQKMYEMKSRRREK